MKYYLLIINIICFIIFGVDKWKAVHRRWRISEKTLMLLALLGGGPGGLLAMFLFRHKIRKALFKLGVPLIIAAWAFVLIRFGFVKI